MSQGWRTRPLPPKWEATRRRILARDDGQCQLRYRGCTRTADAVDHTVPVSRGGDDEDTNLQAVCRSCHAVKTNQERIGERRQNRRARPVEPHPGLIRQERNP